MPCSGTDAPSLRSPLIPSGLSAARALAARPHAGQCVGLGRVSAPASSARSTHHAAGRTRVGATESDVRAYEALVGNRLPPLYVGYLLQFGQRDDDLQMADDTDSRLGTLVKFHREQARSEVSPGAVMIDVNGLSANRALMYDLDEGTQPQGRANEPAVAASESGEVLYRYAHSFTNHLYRQAFVRGRFRSGSQFSLRRSDEGLLPTLREGVEALGFEAHRFSDDLQVCMERGTDGYVYIVRTPGRTSVYGCFGPTAARDEVKQTLLQRYALQDSSPR